MSIGETVDHRRSIESPTRKPFSESQDLALKLNSAREAISPETAKKPFFSLHKSNKKRWVLLIPALLLLAYVGRWTYEEMITETTDDAFVTAHLHTISSRVSGTVIGIPVNENQFVHKGDVLILLDPKDFVVAQRIAAAKDFKARSIYQRWGQQEFLHPVEKIQKESDLADSQAAEAALEQATLSLSYTQIRAPEDGKVGNRAVETGQQVQSGLALMALLEPVPWVVANFKESQAARIRTGQKVRISVDAISGHEFTGTVDSIAPGSGAVFSLLPPDNATGNFTKIMQRIPVKIVLDLESTKGYEDRLTTGMSAAATVYH
jgi:membrane fusion protein (multidrug efflux system)